MPDEIPLAAISAVLYQAAEIVAEGYLKGEEACDWLGGACDPISDKARRWCAGGAILRATWELHGDRVDICLGKAVISAGDRWMDVSEAAEAWASEFTRNYVVGAKGLVDWNDSVNCHQHKMVALLRGAADAASRADKARRAA